MVTLCTADDLALLLNRVFTTDEEEAVDTLISLAQGELEMISNRPLSPTPVTEVARRVGSEIFLNRTPVISVQSVSSLPGLVAVDAASYEVRPWGVLLGGLGTVAEAFAPAEWATRSGVDAGDVEYQVSYTAGLTTSDWRYQGARSLLIGRIIRTLNKMTDDALGVDRLTQEGYAASYMAEGWTPQELATAKRLKKRTVAR